MKTAQFPIMAIAAIIVALPITTRAATTINFQEDVSPIGAYQSGIATIRNNSSANTNFGSDLAVIAGTTTTDTLRGEFSFPVSAIPTDATVSSATLTLVGGTSDATSTTSVNPVLDLLSSGFTESTVTYNTQPGFSTELTRLTGVNPQATAGNTFVFPSTPAFVSAAQDAVMAGGSLNFVLKLDTETTTRNVLNFVSDDPTGAGSYTTANQPILTITYTPEPASTGLFCFVSAALLTLRRRRAAAQ